MKHSKKIIAIAQINKYFDGYRSKILKTLPDLIKKQDHKLVDQLHQDTKFTSQLGVFDTIIVNHYYKDQLIATYPWVLTYWINENNFTITDDILGMQTFHDTIKQILQQLKAITKEDNIKAKKALSA